MFINYDIINMNEHPTIKKNDLFSFLYVCSDIMNGKEEFLINNNNNNKDIIQSLIVDIAKHNISKIWNEQPSEKHFISFWMKHRNNCCNNLHVENEYDNDDDDCITTIVYLNDNNASPTFFMEVNPDNYKEKQYEFTDFSLSFPKIYNATTFGKNILHGKFDMFCYNNKTTQYIINDCNRLDRSLLVVNVSKKKPQFVPVFDNVLLIQRLKNRNISYDIMLQTENHNNKTMFYLEQNNNIKHITCPPSLFENKIIHNAIQHGPQLFHLSTFNQYIEPHIENTSIFKLKSNKEVVTFNENVINSLKNKLDNNIRDMANNMNELNNKDNVRVNEVKTHSERQPQSDKPRLPLLAEKFVQRHIIHQFLDDLTCKWMIFESERYIKQNNSVWENTRHSTYPTYDIAIEKIPSLFSFCLHGIMPEIKKQIGLCYTISIKNIDIRDLFIVKYGEHEQQSLDLHYDGMKSNITASILLNNNFQGAELEYEDGCIHHLNTGSLNLHTHRHKHKILPLKNGTRYVLVYFLHVEF